MLLRGQNLLGYRHYADDVVDKFVETCAKNGIGVFRIFDALKTAIIGSEDAPEPNSVLGKIEAARFFPIRLPV